MSQAAPPSDQTGSKTKSPLAPPDERFWQRYSPHAEFPLSGAGSLVVHILVFGLMALAGVLAGMLLDQSNRKLPVEAVRIIPGGGGNTRGVGDAPNTGGTPKEATEQQKEETPPDLSSENLPDKKIDVTPSPKVKPEFENPTGRQIPRSDASSTFAKLRNQASRIQGPGDAEPGYGQGGTGSGGGSGEGKGKGNGPGNGEGTAANLTQREKRQIRWVMGFRTSDSADYVAQLQGLGAFLAFPVAERGDDFDYKIVRNLSVKPAKLQDLSDDDVNQIASMIKWFDKNPKSAVGVLRVLRIPVPQIPENRLHFFACMPEQLEHKLLSMELDYLRRKHPKLTENDIKETKFELRVKNGKYEPEVKSQTLERR